MAFTFSTSQLPKVARTWGVLCILTWKCASRRSGVHFFDISISKSAPRRQFLTLLTLKCASRHNGVHFFDISTSKSVVRTWGVLCILTWKCASRFISHLARWLRTRRFSERTFRPSGATNHWKNTVSRDFFTFSRTCAFFLLTLYLLWSSLFCSSLLWLFPPLLSHLSILSEVWLLNFLRSQFIKDLSLICNHH